VRSKPLAVAALVVAGSLALAACGGSEAAGSGRSGTSSASPSSTPSASETPTGDFDDADVAFATDMIPHHRQAVQMAELAAERAENPEVKDLARHIMNAQDPEIRTMSGWLTGWGKPVPEEMSGMDMSDSMPGMMSDEDMQMLMDSSGADFDRTFLTMMTQHHQGAIEMAKTEQSDGKSADAIALARQIESAQTNEITTMQGLLK
jgi:uncharacterized protein (DUF305 family)